MTPSRVAEPRPRPPVAVALAWRLYLHEIRAADPAEYERVEEQAWRLLRRELDRLGR